MIISDRLGASALVDSAQPREHLDAACEVAARRCIGNIVRRGEESGAFIRPESVWVTRQSSVLEPDRVMVCVEWSPDPSEGVELRGGVADGQVINVPRQADGSPPRTVWFRLLGEPVAYECAGIDSERDRWVYLDRPSAS